MNVLLIDLDPKRTALLQQALSDHGYTVVASLTDCSKLAEHVERYKADAIIIDTDIPDRDTLESMRQISEDNPRPIIMFAEKSDRHTISKAIKAGVSAYVVDAIESRKLTTIMDLAIARFREYQALRGELDQMRGKLADRRDIDKAKGLLIKQKSISEDEAYTLLRKFAMDSNRSIGEVSRNLIAAADLLNF